MSIVRKKNLGRLGNSQMLRYAGLFTWAAVGLWLVVKVLFVMAG